jgi:type I restriction enzyme S subunit
MSRSQVAGRCAKYEMQTAMVPAFGASFDLIATAQQGVARLRLLVLALAVQGMLTRREGSDGSADALITQLRDIRSKAEPVRGQRSHAQAIEDDFEKPCELPSGWAWVRLSDLGDFRSGKTPSTGRSEYWNGTYPWVSPKDMKELTITSTQDWVTEKALEDGLSLVPENSVLVVVRSGILRRMVPVAVTALPCTVNQDIKALCLLVPKMARYVQLMVQGFESFILAHLTKIGTTVESIKFEEFARQPFPLPPLAEQARIVARVEELMQLCDALEAHGRLQDEQHARLVATLFDALAASASAEALAENWQRIATHFDLLLDRPAAVDTLEQTLLQLAVRGLLVPQDPTDEAAIELITRIRAERNRSDASGETKQWKQRGFDEVTERPFELPTSWKWVSFNEVVRPDKPISYGVLVPGPDSADGVPFVRLADISLTNPPARPAKSISSEVDSQFERTRLDGGEILIGVVGSIGKLGIAPMSWKGANIARAICRIVPTPLVDKEYVVQLLQSEFMQSRFKGDTRTLAQPTLNVGLIRSCPIPLPPLAEQHRIVARVEQLRRLCANLRECLHQSRTTQSHLADALVSAAARSPTS